jgi:hypothetical protein
LHQSIGLVFLFDLALPNYHPLLPEHPRQKPHKADWIYHIHHPQDILGISHALLAKTARKAAASFSRFSVLNMPP